MRNATWDVGEEKNLFQGPRCEVSNISVVFKAKMS